MNINKDLPSKPYILAVDDEQVNRYLLEDLIETHYELNLVDSGKACLKALDERLPELILLDISMPNMDGFEVCRLVKANPKTQHIPIIFLTARITVEDERKGLQLGAVDYITKPFSEIILLARIHTHLELNRMHHLLQQSYTAIKKDQTYIEYIMDTMRRDKRFVADNIEALIAPLETSNGDIVLSASTPNGHRHFLIGDFTGHGLSAAIAGPLVSSLFYTQSEKGVELKDIIKTLNTELFYKLPPEIFMAAIWIDWNTESNQITLWNCGMPALFHFRGGGKRFQYESQYLPLGITEFFIEEVVAHSFIGAPNDILFAYSDGVQEVRSDLGEVFGVLRMDVLLHQVVNTPVNLSFVMDTLKSYANGKEIQDDITLVQLTLP